MLLFSISLITASLFVPASFEVVYEEAGLVSCVMTIVSWSSVEPTPSEEGDNI